MTKSGLHVIGSTHQARFGESFDAQLAEAIVAAADPARAGAELDELALLGVLAHYAAAGRDHPDQVAHRESWGLEPDPVNRRLRRHHYIVQYSATRVDVFVSTGVTIAPDQTVLAAISVRPEIRT